MAAVDMCSHCGSSAARCLQLQPYHTPLHTPGNGFPIGGVITSHALASTFANGMEYFNTFGGCNAAVAAGRAVLRELRDMQLQQRAHWVGRYMLACLKQLAAEFPNIIGDVRGCGLFVGLELVSCPVAKTPAPLAAKALKEGAKARGVLLSTDGPLGHVVKIKPPMVFGYKEVDIMVEAMRLVLSGISTPERWQQLAAQEQQHHVQHVAPVMARYAANEARLWALQQQSRQHPQQLVQQPLPDAGCGMGVASEQLSMLLHRRDRLGNIAAEAAESAAAGGLLLVPAAGPAAKL